MKVLRFFDPDAMVDALDAWHQAETQRNESDWAGNPSQQATNQHFIDVRAGLRKREIVEVRDRLGGLLADWIGTPLLTGKPRTDRPPMPIWTLLSYDQQRAVDGFLARNAWASQSFSDQWIAAERRGRTQRDPAVYRSSNFPSPSESLIDVQDIRDNYKQGMDAEEEYLKERKRTDPGAQFFRRVRLYVPSSPDYMVADALITGGGGVLHIQIIEIKSGNATLTKNQVRILAEAAKSGNVYFVKEEIGRSTGSEDRRPTARQTLAKQRIIPIVTVVGGNQEAIKSQFRDYGVEFVPRGGGRIGRVVEPE